MSSELTNGGGAAGNAGASGGDAGAGAGGSAPPANGGSGGAGGNASGGSSGGGSGSWMDALPDEFKSDPSIQGFKSPADLVKSYIHAQKMVGADKVVVPGKHATDDDWKGVFKKLGLPESPDKYDFKAEGADPEFIKGFVEAAHKTGLLPKQVNEIYGWMTDVQKKFQEKVSQDAEATVKVELGKLKEEWGGESGYAKNMAVAKSALFNFFGKDTADWVDKTGLGNDPQFIKLMHKVGQAMSEDKIKGEGGVSFTDTQEQIHKQIEDHLKNSSGPYWDSSHPEHQKAVEHVRGLYERLGKK